MNEWRDAAWKEWLSYAEEEWRATVDMGTSPCKPLPTRPVPLTDAILGSTNKKATKAHVHSCLQWHAARTREIVAWSRKPQTSRNQAIIGQLAEGLRNRGTKDKGILPHMPESLAVALNSTNATCTTPMTGDHAPTGKEWEDRVNALKKAAHEALMDQKAEKPKRGKSTSQTVTQKEES